MGSVHTNTSASASRCVRCPQCVEYQRRKQAIQDLTRHWGLDALRVDAIVKLISTRGMAMTPEYAVRDMISICGLSQTQASAVRDMISAWGLDQTHTDALQDLSQHQQEAIRSLISNWYGVRTPEDAVRDMISTCGLSQAQDTEIRSLLVSRGLVRSRADLVRDLISSATGTHEPRSTFRDGEWKTGESFTRPGEKISLDRNLDVLDRIEVRANGSWRLIIGDLVLHHGDGNDTVNLSRWPLVLQPYNPFYIQPDDGVHVEYSLFGDEIYYSKKNTAIINDWMKSDEPLTFTMCGLGFVLIQGCVVDGILVDGKIVDNGVQQTLT